MADTCKLERYAELYNDEHSEAMLLLSAMDRYSYVFSEKLNKAVEAEIKASVDYYHENTRIVKRTIERSSYEVEELEWLE